MLIILLIIIILLLIVFFPLILEKIFTKYSLKIKMIHPLHFLEISFRLKNPIAEFEEYYLKF